MAESPPRQQREPAQQFWSRARSSFFESFKFIHETHIAPNGFLPSRLTPRFAPYSVQLHSQIHESASKDAAKHQAAAQQQRVELEATRAELAAEEAALASVTREYKDNARLTAGVTEDEAMDLIEHVRRDPARAGQAPLLQKLSAHDFHVTALRASLERQAAEQDLAEAAVSISLGHASTADHKKRAFVARIEELQV